MESFWSDHTAYRRRTAASAAQQDNIRRHDYHRDMTTLRGMYPPASIDFTESSEVHTLRAFNGCGKVFSDRLLSLLSRLHVDQVGVHAPDCCQ